MTVPTHRYRDHYPAFLSVSDFPQGVAYLAASLKQAGHEVFGLNLNNILGYASAHAMISNKIKEKLDEVKPDLIGLGGICVDYTFLKDAIQVIRLFSKAPIVLGGGIVSNDADFIFSELKPDYAVVGEGEEAIVSIANGHEKKGIVHFPQEKYQPLDLRPFPDYEPFNIKDMLDNYSAATRVLYRYSRLNPRPMIISTARSCPYRCSFCVHTHGVKYRARSISNIMLEVKQLYETYSFNILLIQDELFAVNNKRMREFCEVLIENKIKEQWDFDWMFQTHANAKFDLETLKLAKQSGCYFFSYGLESASPVVLKSMKKQTKIPQIIEAIEMAEKVNIGFGGNLIFGDPAETEATILETMDFYYQHCLSSFVFLGFLLPYPGSDIFDYCVKTGRIKDKKFYYENVDRGIYNMTSIPDENFARWVTFLDLTEKSWFNAKRTIGDYEPVQVHDPIAAYEKALTYHVKAECPYCHKEVHYYQAWKGMSSRMYLGPGCTHCNRRIRIDLKENYEKCIEPQS